MSQSVRIRVLRQDEPDGPSRWEEFSVPYEPDMNVIYCLMQTQRNPVTANGEKTTPVVWEAHCLEEVCGACTMVVNGRVRQACAALVDQLTQPIELRPMKKFPVVRDLIVDRSRMFKDLIKIKGWIPIQGTYDLGAGPRMNPSEQEWAYTLATCMTCGCCLEACPNLTNRSGFIGPSAISQVRLFNAHPTGRLNAAQRLDAMMEPGGISECGNAQNCVEVCPKNIPLTTSIGRIGRDVTIHALGKLFGS
jgi:succinate dehydrogenase / fumarate reductase iron-sulfur subunit